MESETAAPIVETRTRGNNHPVHYESGMHVFPIVWDKWDDVAKKYLEGDLSAHMWNPEVAKRIRQYQPYVLGLDSLSPAWDSKGKGISWPWLPGSPTELTGRSKMFVVAGDLLHWQLMEGNEADPMYGKLEKAGMEEVGDYAKKAGGEFLGSGILGLLGVIAALRMESKTTRRGFLKLSLGLLASGLLTSTIGKAAPLVESFSTDPRFSALSHQITEMTKFNFAKSDWLDGRTALVQSKTEDEIDRLDDLGLIPKDAEGAVLMGFPHAYEGVKTQADKEARNQEIRKYAKTLVDVIYPMALQIGDDKDSPEYKQYVTDVILTYMFLVDTYTVDDSDLSKSGPKIQQIGHRLSPSVVEAVKQLGDPFKYFER